MTARGRIISEGRKRAQARRVRSEAARKAWADRKADAENLRNSKVLLAGAKAMEAGERATVEALGKKILDETFAPHKFDLIGTETGRFAGTAPGNTSARFNRATERYLRELESIVSDTSNFLRGIRP